MRIALFSDTYYPIPDGVSKHLVDFKKELKKRGHEVRIYTLVKGDGDVYSLPSLPFPLYKEYRMGLPNFDLYKDLYRFSPDIIHVHTPFILGTLGHHYHNRMNIPIIGTYHTDFVNMDNTIKFPFIKSLLNLGFIYNMYLYKKFDLIVSPSEPIARMLRNYKIDSKVIHVGIDLSSFKYDEDKDDYFLFLGRLTYDKGITHFLEAASQMPEEKFIVAGVGPLVTEVKRYASKYENIKYLGYVDEKTKLELLSKARLLILPSRAETFGIVYVEAMASGTPVIASNESREIGILKDGVNGWLVKFGCPSCIVEKVKQVKKMDLKEISKNALKSSMEFGIESTVEKLLEVYGGLIELYKNS